MKREREKEKKGERETETKRRRRRRDLIDFKIISHLRKVIITELF